MLEDKPIIRGAGNGIILRILCRIAVDAESLLVVELKLAVMAYWLEREALLIRCHLLDSFLELN